MKELLEQSLELQRQMTTLVGHVETMKNELLLYKAFGTVKELILYINYLSAIIERIQNTEDGSQLLMESMTQTLELLKEKYPNMYDDTFIALKKFTEEDRSWLENLSQHLQNP